MSERGRAFRGAGDAGGIVGLDVETDWRERHAKRSLRRWSDRDGAWQAHLYGHPEDGAGLWRMLDPIRRRLNMLRRQSGTANESLDALDYDAVMTVAAIATGKEAELGWADLVDLGLFPQFEASLLAGRAAPLSPTPAGAAELFSVIDGGDVDRTGTAAPPASTQARRP
jgi:hypothetical protein